MQFKQSEGSNSHRLTADLFPHSYCSEIYDVFSGNDPRRNLDVEGYGIVETAMAKWENKSRLAKMDEENCKLIQGTRGYYDCRSLFGET